LSTGDIDCQFLSNQADSEIGLLHDCNGNEFKILSAAMVRYLPMLLSSEDIDFRKRDPPNVNGGIACRSNAMAILKCMDRDQYLQLLSNISNNTFRYLLCRAEDCHPEGNFVGHILSWATSFPDGWRWACPICGTWWKPGSKGLGSKVPAIQVFHTAAGVLLAKWPYVASEAQIIALMKVFEMPHEKFDEIFHTDVMKEIWRIVRSHALPVHWQQLQMTSRACAAIDEMNRITPTRNRKHPFRYDHLLPGFSGTFIKVTPDIDIMSIQEVNELLSLVGTHLSRVAAL
jgi:hypothetical protein